MTLAAIACNTGFNVCVLCVVHLSGFMNNLERDSLVHETCLQRETQGSDIWDFKRIDCRFRSIYSSCLKRFIYAVYTLNCRASMTKYRITSSLLAIHFCNTLYCTTVAGRGVMDTLHRSPHLGWNTNCASWRATWNIHTKPAAAVLSKFTVTWPGTAQLHTSIHCQKHDVDGMSLDLWGPLLGTFKCFFVKSFADENKACSFLLSSGLIVCASCMSKNHMYNVLWHVTTQSHSSACINFKTAPVDNIVTASTQVWTMMCGSSRWS